MHNLPLFFCAKKRKNKIHQTCIEKNTENPEGAVIKHTACPKEMFKAVLRARPFDSEEECLDAVLKHKVQKGDAVFIRFNRHILF